MKLTRLGASLGMALMVAGLTTAPQYAFAEAGDWLIRARGIGIVPTGDSASIKPDLTAGGIDVQPDFVPELDFTYMATDNLGVELILAVANHDIEATGLISGVGTAADIWHLPPTLSLQWHFFPDSNIRPYIGAGINYTIIFAEDASGSLETALGPTEVSADNSVGWAVQAGVDIDLTDDIFLNLDVKYVDIDTDVELKSGGVTRAADLSIDPIIVGVGLGVRF